jgi:methyl-accepting chemotaxis protein
MYKTSSRIIKNIMLYIFPIIIVVIFTISILYYQQVWNFTVKSLENNLKTIGITSVSLLDGDLFEQITEKEQFISMEYKRLVTILKRIQNNNDLETNAVKALRLKGNITNFIVTSDNENHINQEFNLWFEMNSTFNSGNITIKKAYKRQGKNYISAFAPIRNSLNQIVAILQIDKAIDNYLPNVFDYLKLPFILSFFFLVAGLLILKGILRPVQKVIDSYAHYFTKLSSEKISIDEVHTDNGYLIEIKNSFEQLKSELIKSFESMEDKEKLQRQIKEMLHIVNTAANGDFTITAHVTADTLGVLADSFNLMITDLSNLIKDVKNGIDHLSQFTKKILMTITTMANGATSQAGQIEQISRLAKDIAKVASDTNNSAMRASESARVAKHVAEKGGSVLKKSIGAMHRIRETVLETSKRIKLLGESSQRISEITEFISYVANRTNLLALNATIEAAKAGDSGRGFTVVVDEVRKLAERSKLAAQEINKLIENIQNSTTDVVTSMEQGNKEVAEGTKMMDEAGHALLEILRSVDISTTSVEEISAATKRQSQSNENIVRIMEKIAHIAQQTAKGAKESEKEITQLEFLSKSLNTAIAKFTLTH